MISQITKYAIILSAAFMVIFGNVALATLPTVEQHQPLLNQSIIADRTVMTDMRLRHKQVLTPQTVLPKAALTIQTGFPVSVNTDSDSDSVASESSPVVVDVDGDGDYELFMGGYRSQGSPNNKATVHGWDHLGNLLPGFPVSLGDTKIVASLAAADLDNDPNNDLEIIVGTSDSTRDHNRARVFVLHHNGDIMTGWPQSTLWNDSEAPSWAWNEVTSVAAADIDGDDQLEVLALTTANTTRSSLNNSNPAYNAYAWEANGDVISGWPTTAGDASLYDNRVGIYGFIAAGDFNGDGKANPVFGRDYNILFAYDGNGSPLNNWPILTFKAEDTQNGVWVDDADPINFGNVAPVLADLDWDGTIEMVAVGYRRIEGDDPQNPITLVYNSNATRRTGWTTSPAQGTSWREDQNCAPYGSASVANLDDDAELEIITSTTDGYIRVYNHDNTLLWQYNYANGRDIIAGEVIVGDIDGDLEVELIFASYDRTGDSSGDAKIFGLEKDGTPAADFPLTGITHIGDKKIGTCSTPALADIDNDGDVELIVGRKADVEQLMVYDLPGAYHANKMPWPQARHDAQRTAMFLDTTPNLTPSAHKLLNIKAENGEVIRLAMHLENGGGSKITDTLTMTVKIPPPLINLQDVQITPSNIGTVVTTTNTITWTGILSPTKQEVTVSYGVLVSTTEVLVLTSYMTITHPTLGPAYREVTIITNPLYNYLPFIPK